MEKTAGRRTNQVLDEPKLGNSGGILQIIFRSVTNCLLLSAGINPC
jgi:hypothetical protein